MLQSQKISVRLSEIRQRLNEVAGLEGNAFTDEIRQESDKLTTEYRDKETQYRAALTAEGNEAEQRAAGAVAETAEDRERRELRGRARLARYVSAAISRQPVSGAEAEYAAAEDCAGLVPLQLFGGTAEERAAEWRARENGRAEHRACDTRPGGCERATESSAYRPGNLRSVDCAVSWRRNADCGSGDRVVSRAVYFADGGHCRGRCRRRRNCRGFHGCRCRPPRRLTGALRIRREDTAKLADLESSLRSNLSSVLSDELDKQIAAGRRASAESERRCYAARGPGRGRPLMPKHSRAT